MRTSPILFQQKEDTRIFIFAISHLIFTESLESHLFWIFHVEAERRERRRCRKMMKMLWEEFPEGRKMREQNCNLLICQEKSSWWDMGFRGDTCVFTQRKVQREREHHQICNLNDDDVELRNLKFLSIAWLNPKSRKLKSWNFWGENFWVSTISRAHS